MIYLLRQEGIDDRRIARDTDEEAIEYAHAWARLWRANGSTIWVYTSIFRGGEPSDDPDIRVNTPIDPVPPRCTEESGHAFEEVEDSRRANNGPGDTYMEECTHCGAVKYVNTGAQSHTGQEGLTSIRYERARAEEDA